MGGGVEEWVSGWVRLLEVNGATKEKGGISHFSVM